MADDEEDEDEQLVDVGPQFDQGLEKFHLPYKVATVQEGFNQRAYWDQDAQGEPEWLWGRAHDYMKIQLAPSKFLLNNKDTFASEFEACEVPAQEFHFRKKAEKDDRKKNNRWVEHTMESRGFLIALMWCMKNRALALESKKKALALLKGLIASSLAFAAAAGPVAMSLSVPDEGGLIHQALLTFSGQGISHMSGQGLCPSMGLPLHYGTSCIKPIGWAPACAAAWVTSFSSFAISVPIPCSKCLAKMCCKALGDWP